MFPSTRSEDTEEISPSQLRPGLFIRLPAGWIAHPFLFNQFRIANDKQVAILKSLGLASITHVPARSTTAPLPPARTGAPPSPEPPRPVENEGESRRRTARLSEQRARIAECEKHYLQAAGYIQDALRSIHADPEQALVGAREMVGNVVDTFTAEGDMVIHLMSDRVVEGNHHFHSLNVMILSLLLGRACKLQPADLHILGEGALFHDVGKCRVPDAVLRNPARNRHEEEFYRLHTLYGGDLARNMGIFPPQAIAIIESHHETLDGKGFPRGQSGDRVPLTVRIVGLTNRYDNLCNPLREDQAITPAEAMTHLYRTEQGRWGKELLEAFIHTLGVYPPGSLVQLSNGNVAVVLAVDQSDLLRPEVLVYDPDVPRSEALIVDLAAAEDVKVDHVLPPHDLAPEIRRYLAPRHRLSYFHAGRKP
ncbi:MAG: DUF3391 domain-containing protein [Rhodocyclaceae bacterium]|nr:DUF3391 domain-containing protein [Rhodocyclaceae bacterium]